MKHLNVEMSERFVIVAAHKVVLPKTNNPIDPAGSSRAYER